MKTKNKTSKTVTWPWPMKTEEDLAKERLIAAAPELLGAAKAGLTLAESLDLSDLASNIRAAIAKAEGR